MGECTKECILGMTDSCGWSWQNCQRYSSLYNNKINARILIGQSAMVYCAGKPIEKSRVFWIII